MGKLHQLIAVEKDVKSAFSKIVEECSKTFNQRTALFMETRKQYHAFAADDTDHPDEEFSPMQTTVKSKLDYVEGSVIRALDVLIQKERANAVAKADIEIEQLDGTKKVLISDVPVTALVQLENVLEDLRNRVYNEIPTLDPSKVWSKDETTTDIWIAEPVLRQRTRKVSEPLVLYPATDKHPAQTQVITVDKPVGNWTHSTKSGCLSPKQKSDLLGKLERLIAGVKIARAKANDIDVSDSHIGKTIFNYINEALK
jgi:hypothetical protein